MDKCSNKLRSEGLPSPQMVAEDLKTPDMNWADNLVSEIFFFEIRNLPIN